jgi:hypothetical protein
MDNIFYDKLKGETIVIIILIELLLKPATKHRSVILFFRLYPSLSNPRMIPFGRKTIYFGELCL